MGDGFPAPFIHVCRVTFCVAPPHMDPDLTPIGRRVRIYWGHPGEDAVLASSTLAFRPITEHISARVLRGIR